MGIVEKLSQLITSKSNLRNKINEKISDTSKQIPENTKLEDFSSYVDNIESGGGEDFKVTSLSYLCYGFSDEKFVRKMLSWYIPKTGTNANNEYTYTFGYLDIPDFSIQLLKSHKKENGTITRQYYGNGDYDYYNMRYTFTWSKCQNVYLDVDNNIPLNADEVFYYCQLLKSVSAPNNKLKIGYGGYMFYGSNNLTSIPILDVDKCVSISSMFGSCTSLKKIQFEGRLFLDGIQPGESQYFGSMGIRPSFYNTFYNCPRLESIKGLDVTNAPSDTNTNSMFSNCKALKELDFTGTENVQFNFDISTTGLDRDGLMNMLNTLPKIDKSNPITITIGETKKALLENIDILQFALKGYTLA